MTKKINITKPSLPPKKEYIKEIEQVWENHWLTNNGPIHNEFEDKLKNYLKVSNASLFVNGHSALDIAIKALELEGEVITTPFTFASTTHAIVQNNLEPVFADIDPENYNIDPKSIEGLITERTSAIIPVHVYGNPCDIRAIRDIADRYNLKVIYDAAHTFGVEIDGEGIGNYGDISMFSLHATKVFHSIEGGVLTYADPGLKEKVEAIKNFGKDSNGEFSYVGQNAKMNEFQAAMGLVNLRYIDQEISRRKELVEMYRDGLKPVAGIKVLADYENVKNNYAYFPVLIDKDKYRFNRDELHDYLKDNNINTRKYFYPLTVDFPAYKGRFEQYELPNARKVADNILSLPLYGELQKEDIKLIIDLITG